METKYQRCGRWVLFLTLLVINSTFFMKSASAQQKREFRGAWIQCVNGQFRGIGTEVMQKTLRYQLDELQKDGCNAIIFQVRPECDALYESKLEPWSYYLTGEQGRAPQPYWDPLQWMVAECHRRGMELHAWINPYRAKTKTPHASAANHVVRQHPERCFQYDGLTLLNPALSENRDYICEVVKDIVERYDVDGLHIDDYFYPYPVAGVTIPDDVYYQVRDNRSLSIGDWRRDNVNQFVRQLSETIHQTKPWVKFGVSPFGIYRNQRNDPNGSRTNGLQNYDDLYADILLWVNEGWIDYCVPQLYWEIGNKAADYDELIRWWNRNCSRVPLYIGEDIERTVKHPDRQNPQQHQLSAKMALHKQMENVKGTVLWYAKTAVDNVGHYGTSLRNNYWRTPALQPLMPHIDKKAPNKVRKMKVMDVDGQKVLFWTEPKAKRWGDIASRYVVYRFDKGEKVNIDVPSHIVAVTAQPYYDLPKTDGKSQQVYVVTALDRMQNESKAVKKKIK
ncbi:MAG: family 10 glycosylhydrolase [Prevotella sp.]|nr:family 10 glycosylhydrolase [Prevotella sp.]